VNVLHIHSGNLYGGVETFLLTLARSHEFAPSMKMSVALCFDERIAADLRREAVPISILGSVRLRRPDSIWRARRNLKQLIHDTAFDVAVCHQAWPLAIFGPVLKEAGVPLVSWLHMTPTGHWLERLASRVEPDLIVCNSRFTASTLRKTGAAVETVYYPVIGPQPGTLAITPRATLRQELNTTPNDVVIAQVSRMEPWKGHALHLEALARLRVLPNWTCWFVGGAQKKSDVTYLSSLEQSAKQLGVGDRVRFTGHRSDIADVLAAADIFCQPNTEPEPFGISFVEALACGRPVVTSSIGGALEIVNETCGALVPRADSSALATALSRLITQPDARERLGREGPRRARTLCDPQTQTRAIAAMLQRVCCDRMAAH
jgi:glycosyltransferase involved in cell wall biosynthesis